MNFRVLAGTLTAILLVGLSGVYGHRVTHADSLQRQHLYEEAEEYYEQGQILTHAGQFEDALPFYRAANRLFTNSTKFLYYLGLSEFNNQFHVKAHARFHTLLDLIARGHTGGEHDALVTASADEYEFEIEEMIEESSTALTPPHHNTGTIESLLKECARRMNESPSLTPFEEMSQKRRPTVLAMHERPLATIQSSEEDLSLHLRLEFQEPFLVRNVLAELGMEARVAALFAPGGDSRSLLPALEAHFGEHLVEMYPQNILSPPTKKYTRPLREALEYVAHPSGAYTAVDASDPGVYLQWSVNASTLEQLVDLISPGGAGVGGANGGVLGLGGLSSRITASLQQYLLHRYSQRERHEGRGTTAREADPESPAVRRALYDYLAAATHWNMVLLGEMGAGMFYHEDLIPVGSYQLQLLGHKFWRICTPDAKDSSDGDGSKAVCYEGSVGAGDLVYYPPSWGHETSSTGRMSVALSSSIILNTGMSNATDDDVETHDNNIFHRFVRDSCDVSTAGTVHEDRAGRQTVSAFSFSASFCDHVL
jgi:tetratricopeptide (TPR) repeat protein